MEPQMKIIIRKNGTKRLQTLNTEPSATDQQFAEETDVNYIMSKYNKTGQINFAREGGGVFADVSEVPDLHQATLIVQESKELFNLLPAKAREKFENNPLKMMDFLNDPSNQKEAMELGLLQPRPIGDHVPNDLNEQTSEPKKSKKKTESNTPDPE